MTAAHRAPPPPPISKRMQRDIDDPIPLKKGVLRFLEDPYHKTKNPNGIVNLGVAENTLMADELLDKLPKSLHMEYEDLGYGRPNGSVRLRTALANFINAHFNPATPIKADHIVATNGACAAINTFSYTLCNPGDAMLITAPYYGAFDPDVSHKSGARAITVNLNGRSPFEVDHIEALEQCMSKCQAEGIIVKGMILSNPHNPLARCYSREVLEALLKFASKHNIHVVSDEIYALSLFDHHLNDADAEEPQFTFDADNVDPSSLHSSSFISMLALPNLVELINPELVHIVYGMSKDFCINGLRVGFAISPFNSAVLEGIGGNAEFSWVSSITDSLCSTILEDTKWTNWFLLRNQKKLAASYLRTCKVLDHLNISYLPAQAGHFMWIDLKPYCDKIKDLLMERSGEAPKIPSQTLFNALIEHKVYIAFGEAFHTEEIGRFRLSYSMNKDAQELGLMRMEQVLKCITSGDIELSISPDEEDIYKLSKTLDDVCLVEATVGEMIPQNERPEKKKGPQCIVS
ncbi:hypothetical protein BZG36_00507 [Bifiguratus adelaidae]|uniref:Aminotransferase class I/classII large domain-containing protein n=1 Tax=Bifiguratus adelaidae TaxID=1938954 RepID=A0A261Y7F0_9FUNG|nr:hypothetical protein BZG36_00507 [Bifiguratus adelaidae]